MRDDEKLVWISDVTGDSIEFSATSNFFWSEADKMDSLNNAISTIQGIGQNGVYVTGSQIAQREIPIKAQIKGSAAEYESRRAELIEKISPTHTGRLVYSNSNITRYIRCYVKSSPSCARGVYALAEMVFYCPYPFWKEGDGTEIPEAYISGTVPNIEFPLEITEEGYELGYRMPSLVTNIINTGHQPAELIIEFRADIAVSNPRLTNIVTEEFFAVDYSMLAGDVIRVKTGYGVKSVTLIRDGVETNIYNYKTAGISWLKLAVGDNYLRASASVDDNLSVVIMYEFAYNGV